MLPLPHKANLIKAQGVNARGEKHYNAGPYVMAPFFYIQSIEINHEIKVNWQGLKKMIRSPKGEKIQSTAAVFMAIEPNPNDLIRFNGKDHQILSIEPINGLTGKTVGYEVLV